MDSGKQERWIERRSRRIEIAWERCKDWFVGAGEDEERISIHFAGIVRGRLKKGLRAVERFTHYLSSSSAWNDPATFDPECAGHDAFVDQLEAGNVVAYHVNYRVEHDGVALPVMLSIHREEGRLMSVVAYTAHHLFDPGTTLRQRFDAVAVHAIDLQGWFQGVAVLIAVRGADRKLSGRQWI